jgi:hypothetical protein
MADQRRAGLIQLLVQGVVMDAVGSFTYNLGRPKRETMPGSDGIHGFKETPQPAFIEGKIRDRGTHDLALLSTAVAQTVTLTLGNNKVIVLRDGWFAGDGNASTEEAEIEVRWEGANAEEVP